ncbi:MAG: hypothetical protein MZU97_15100 [Bacillus subtilis]|nr:hypothetical protein [Bacillus subtilis]
MNQKQSNRCFSSPRAKINTTIFRTESNRKMETDLEALEQHQELDRLSRVPFLALRSTPHAGRLFRPSARRVRRLPPHRRIRTHDQRRGDRLVSFDGRLS